MAVQLLLVRHAIANDRTIFAQTGKPDSDRPITDEGRAKMREQARGLRALVPHLDILATSPFLRARQTAHILGEVFGAAVTEAAVLAHSEGPADFIDWTDGLPAAGVLAAVGHEPALSDLAGYCLSASSTPLFSLKKGGACLLTFHHTIAPGAGTLGWLLTPKQLRLIARAR